VYVDRKQGWRSQAPDRRFLTTIVGIAAAFTLGLLIFAFVTDFPGPPPAGEKELTSDAPAEDVRR
jgi:hypothetical protein